MSTLKIGDKIHGMNMLAKGATLAINQDGMFLICSLPRSEKNANICNAGNPVYFKSFNAHNAAFLLMKSGVVQWLAAPVNIQTLNNPFILGSSRPSDEEGYYLYIICADPKTETVYAMKVVQLPPRFSQSLYDNIMATKSDSFNPEGYAEDIRNFMSGHTSRQLASMATSYCTVV